MTHYLEAIKRPFEFSKLWIGLVFLAVPFVNIVTGIFVYGYIVESVRLTLNKRKGLPKWGNLGGLFLQGIMVSIISLAYSLPILIFAMISGMGMLWAAITGEGIVYTGYSMIWTGVIGIFTAYVAPSATINYCRRKRLRDAFSKKVFSNTLKWHYLVDWLFAMIYSMSLAIITAILMLSFYKTIIIPVVAVGLFVFIAGITNLTIIAQRYQT